MKDNSQVFPWETCLMAASVSWMILRGKHHKELPRQWAAILSLDRGAAMVPITEQLCTESVLWLRAQHLSFNCLAHLSFWHCYPLKTRNSSNIAPRTNTITLASFLYLQSKPFLRQHAFCPELSTPANPKEIILKEIVLHCKLVEVNFDRDWKSNANFFQAQASPSKGILLKEVITSSLYPYSRVSLKEIHFMCPV